MNFHEHINFHVLLSFKITSRILVHCSFVAKYPHKIVSSLNSSYILDIIQKKKNQNKTTKNKTKQNKQRKAKKQKQKQKNCFSDNWKKKKFYLHNVFKKGISTISNFVLIITLKL